MTKESRTAARANEDQPSSWFVLWVSVVRLLTPRRLRPEVQRVWARSVVILLLFAVATAIGMLVAGGLAVNLAPHGARWLKWPGVICMGLLGWRMVHFFPQVWQNRYDDKFAVAFVAIAIALFLWTILQALA